jgi:hypothetical protein
VTVGEDLTWLKQMSDDEILVLLKNNRPDTPGAELVKAEIHLRIAARQMEAAKESAKLGERVWWLNVVLLILALVALVLTAVQVMVALDVIKPIAAPLMGGV